MLEGRVAMITVMLTEMEMGIHRVTFTKIPQGKPHTRSRLIPCQEQYFDLQSKVWG